MIGPTGFIEVRNITKEYDGIIALKDVSLTLKEGKITGVIGPDGAGKTTLLEIITGLRSPDSGEVLIAGKKWTEDSGSLKRNLGFVPQDFSLYSDLTVEENLFFFGQIYGQKDGTLREKIEKLLDIANLKKARKRQAGKLSGGMKQKLMVLSCLIHEPSVLVLDEPTRGVDPISRTELWELIRFIKEQGTTVILSTSNMEEVSRMDEVVFLAEGRVLVQIEVQNLSELFPFKIAEIKTDRVEDLIEKVEKLKNIKATHVVGRRVRAYFPREYEKKVVEELSQIVKGWYPVSPTAEDVFVYLTGGFIGE